MTGKRKPYLLSGSGGMSSKISEGKATLGWGTQEMDG